MSVLKKMNRKKLIRIVIFVVLFVLAIRFVPFPVWHNMTLQGSQVTKEGEVLDEVTVKLRVWKLYYLFDYDDLRGNVEIITDDTSTKIDYLGTIFGPEDVHWVSLNYYNPESNSFCGGELIFDEVFNTFQIFVNDGRGNASCYVVSEDEQLQPKDILNRFQRIGNSYWDEE